MQNWLKAFLIFGGLGFGCQLAQAEELGKCDPNHYGSEESVLEEYSAQIKGRLFRSNSGQELVVQVFPRPPLIFKSCVLEAGSQGEPGWRVQEFYPSSDQALLVQGGLGLPTTKLKLVNLRTGSQSDLVTRPEYSPDRLLFATVVDRPGLTPPPTGRGTLEVWSCGGGAEECKMVYRFPDDEFQAALGETGGPTPKPSASGGVVAALPSGVSSTPVPVVLPTSELPWMPSQASPGWNAPKPVNGRILAHFLFEWSEPHHLKFSPITRIISDGKVTFSRTDYSCDCDAAKCTCQKGTATAVGKCIDVPMDVLWPDCGYCLAACAKFGAPQCTWSAQTLSQGTEKGAHMGASPMQMYECPADTKLKGAERYLADWENRKAREAAEEKARESERIAEVKAREAAIKAVERAAKEQDLAQKKAEEEKRKEKALQYSKYLETKPDWYVKELKLLSKTRGRVFRRNSGQELVIRVPGKNELTFESKLCEMPGEQGLDVSVVEHFSKSNQILVEIVNSDCDAEVSTSYQLIGLDTGKVEKLLGEDETLSVSPYRNYFAAFARVWGRFGNAHSVAVWSCGSAGKPCKEVLRKKDSDIGHTWALSWVGSHSFDLNFHRDVDNKKVSEFTCSCTPQACECKSKSPK